MKTLSRFFALGIMLVVILSTVGVYAIWFYTGTVEDFQTGIDLGVEIFEYKPEEVLPGDQEATELHENHNNLIKNIVNHIDYGLNATKKPLVRELLEDGAGVVYSNQNVTGGNLKHMLLDSSDVERLMFCVEFVTATEYNAYTFSSNLVGSQNIGVWIDVYKTVIIKTENTWVATKSFIGKAQISTVYTSSSEQVTSINVKTWKNAM